MLVEKYGRPVSCVERFTSYMGDEDDAWRMIVLQNGECKYVTRFSADEGDITLSIERREVLSGFVQLVYQDKENGQVVRKSAIDDL